MDDRKLRILAAVVDEYVTTGEPVGSKTIAALPDIHVSAATIRNDMAVLEQLGLLEQPHTSAGRVQTFQGYKVYIEQCMHRPGLSEEERARLEAAASAEAVVLPEALGTAEASRYWQSLQAAGIVDMRCQLRPGITRKQAMYVADVMSERLQMRSKWKPFQDLWHINNLAQEKWEMQETGKMPPRSDEIDAIFAE